MIAVRGAKISMIFQDPFTSLNPVFAVGEQIAEAIRTSPGAGQERSVAESDRDAGARPDQQNPAVRARDYPHQFSGGMRQRVMIAMALACQPDLLIADEPTTALDVTIQAEILRLLKELQRQTRLTIIYITHNFGIIREVCDRVVVLHQGLKVEEGLTGQVMSQPRDEYTQRLIKCLSELRK